MKHNAFFVFANNKQWRKNYVLEKIVITLKKEELFFSRAYFLIKTHRFRISWAKIQVNPSRSNTRDVTIYLPPPPASAERNMCPWIQTTTTTTVWTVSEFSANDKSIFSAKAFFPVKKVLLKPLQFLWTRLKIIFNTFNSFAFMYICL